MSTNERLVPHLATRRQIFIYPPGAGISTYILDLEVVLRTHPATGYREIGRASGWILLQSGSESGLVRRGVGGWREDM